MSNDANTGSNLFADRQLEVLKERRDRLVEDIGDIDKATPEQMRELSAAHQAMLERTVEIIDSQPPPATPSQ
jgi:hypothetical protein